MGEQIVNIADTEMAPHAETSCGVKIDTTAKGYLQPGFTLRYASADETLVRAAADWGVLFDQFVKAAHARGLKLVTDQATGQTGTEGK